VYLLLFINNTLILCVLLKFPTAGYATAKENHNLVFLIKDKPHWITRLLQVFGFCVFHCLSTSFCYSENWRRQLAHPRTTWMKTIQQDLKSNSLSLNEAIDVAQNHPLWRLMSTFIANHS